MESLKDKSGKKILENYTLPSDCLEQLINRKVYKLEVGRYYAYLNHGREIVRLKITTRLLHYDFNFCVLEMLKCYGTDYKLLNSYDDINKKWTYCPSSSMINTIYIEEITIGTLKPFNIKVIYIFENGKMEKRIYRDCEKKIYEFESDNTFSFTNEYIDTFDFNKFNKMIFFL
jgi:hypothetical protein